MAVNQGRLLDGSHPRCRGTVILCRTVARRGCTDRALRERRRDGGRFASTNVGIGQARATARSSSVSLWRTPPGAARASGSGETCSGALPDQAALEFSGRSLIFLLKGNVLCSERGNKPVLRPVAWDPVGRRAERRSKAGEARDEHPAQRIDELLPWNWRPRLAPQSQAA
jgi:hypothetical protein